MRFSIRHTSIVLMLFQSLHGFSQTVLFQPDNTMRNNQLSHYYKMVTWEDSLYRETTYYKKSSGGSVIEFMNWRIMFPPGYSQSDSSNNKYPMILMLHGSGESGRVWTGNFSYTPADPEYDNNGNNLLWGGREHRDAVNLPATNSRSFPGIVVFPQVSYNGGQEPGIAGTLATTTEWPLALLST